MFPLKTVIKIDKGSSLTTIFGVLRRPSKVQSFVPWSLRSTEPVPVGRSTTLSDLYSGSEVSREDQEVVMTEQSKSEGVDVGHVCSLCHVTI